MKALEQQPLIAIQSPVERRPIEGELRPRSLQLTKSMEGFLNHCDVILDSNNKGTILVRTAKPNADRIATRELINLDFLHSKAFEYGLTYTLRTSNEQAKMIDRCLDLGLPVIPYQALVRDTLIFPYINGVALHTYVGESSPVEIAIVLRELFKSLKRAHDCGVVYGDRWGPNTMVLPDGRALEFDFDIAVHGDLPTASAFEIGQAIYHISHFARENRPKILPVLADILEEDLFYRDADAVKPSIFIENFAKYYIGLFNTDGTLLEGLPPPNLDELSSLLSFIS